MAEAYAELGALEPAIEQLTIATRLGPKFPDLRYRLARLMLEAGQTLEAREELELVVRTRPNFLDALALLGLARYLSGDASGAEEVWRDCLTRRPEDARVEAYLAMLSRGGPVKGGARLGRGVAAVALCACGPSGGPEGAGDRSYAEGRYQEALAAYAPARGNGRRRLGSGPRSAPPALRLGQLREATAAYRALAEVAPERADEAAEGLDLVIVAAERRRDDGALAEAVEALRAVAPDRPLGRHALNLMQVADGPVSPSDFAAALAVATDARTVDSLLVRQADALAGSGECGGAVPLYQSALRRSGRSGSPSAETGLVDCFFRLGCGPAHLGAGQRRGRGSGARPAWTPRPRSAGPRCSGSGTRGCGRAISSARRWRTRPCSRAANARTRSPSLAAAQLNALVSAEVPDSLSTGIP